MQEAAKNNKRIWHLVIGIVMVVAGAAIILFTFLGPDRQDASLTNPEGQDMASPESYIGLDTEAAREKAEAEGRAYFMYDDGLRAESADHTDDELILYTDNRKVVGAQVGVGGWPQDRGSVGGAAEEYIGLSEPDAIEKAEAAGYTHRIAARDGEEYMLTMDYREDRINFIIENGRVVGADFY